MSDSAALLLARGDSTGVVEAFGRAIALDSNQVNAYRGRAIAQKNLGHYELAVLDYNKAILLDSTSAGTYNNRGFAYQLMGDWERSIPDFTRAILLSPGLTQANRNRARSQYSLGHFLEAASDFRAGPYTPATNAYVPIWAYLASRRIGMTDTIELSTQIASVDLAVWPGPVARFYLGRISEKELISATANPDAMVQVEHQCAVAFYLGEQLLWQNPPKLSQARTRFDEAIAICPKTFAEYWAAKGNVTRMP